MTRREKKRGGPNRFKKEITLSVEFEALWNRIKPKTTYRVEFETDTLAARAVAAIKKMEKVQPPKVKVTAGRVEVRKGGVAAEAVSAARERMPVFPVESPTTHRLNISYGASTMQRKHQRFQRCGTREQCLIRYSASLSARATSAIRP